MILRSLRSYFTGLFFAPDAQEIDSPARQGVPYEAVHFVSDGNRLHGYFFRSPKAAGTIVHCHGNTSNITGHFPLILFLVQAGFNVLVFDYRGYGRSEGRPSADGFIRDAAAAVAYVRSRSDVDASRIGLFGQSLGGVAATSVAAADPAIRCVALEGTFTTYREMGWRTWRGRMLFFLTPFVLPDEGPLRSLPLIAPRPVLILHGAKDAVVPPLFARRLYRAARGYSELVLLPRLRHLEGMEEDDRYAAAIIDFFRRHLEGAPPKPTTPAR